jgi:hypothetical protein
MRYSTRAVLGMLLATVLVTTGVAEESTSPWWHFGTDQSAPDAEPSMTAAPTLTPSQTLAPPLTGSTVAAPAAEDKRWLKWPSLPTTSLSKLKWSETTVTEVSPSELIQPKPRRDNFGKPSHVARPRNAWAQPPAETTAATPGPSAWSKVTEGTRSAWHKTVEFVTPGEAPDTSVANNQPRDSWWRRMWSSNEETEGPQTVTEWMAQDRLDP